MTGNQDRGLELADAFVAGGHCFVLVDPTQIFQKDKEKVYRELK